MAGRHRNSHHRESSQCDGRRAARAPALSTGGRFPVRAGPTVFRRKQMNRIILPFWLILLAETARLEAHAFLKHPQPGVGSRVQTSPREVGIRFPENVEPAF